MIISSLFLLGFLLAVVFWGGAGLLIVSLIAACLVPAAFVLLARPPKISALLWVCLFSVVAWGLVGFWRAENGMFAWKVLVVQVIYLVSFLVGASNPLREVRGKKLLSALCAIGAAEVAFAYYGLCSGAEDILGLIKPGEYLGRMSGTFISPNHFADLAGTTGILLLGFAMASRKTVSKVLLGFAGTLALSGVILSGSRIVTCACALAIGVMVLGCKAALSLRSKMAVVLLGSLLLAGSYVFQMGSAHRLTNALRDPAVGARVTVWSDTMDLCLQRPWTGLGMGNFQWFYPGVKSAGITRKVDFAHSDLLQIWAEQGWIGLAVWAAFFVAWGFSCAKPRESLGLAAASAVVFLLAVALVDFPFQTPAVGMFFFLLLGTLVYQDPGSGKIPLVCKTGVWLGLAVLCIAIVRVVVGQILLLEADQARKTLRWDEASRKYRSSVRWNPGNSVVWKWMGELSRNRYLFSRKTNPEAALQAEEFFQRSLQVNGRDGAVWVSQGLLWLDRGERGKARSCLKKAVSLDPQNGFFHDMLAKCLIAEGRLAEARAHLAMALWLYPRDEVARVLLKKIDRKKTHVQG